jgi:transposase
MVALCYHVMLQKVGQVMGKITVTITSHLSVDELANRYRKATDPIERSHFQIVWLLAQGKRVSEVAAATGYCANWIRILARRYNQGGPQALGDQRQHNKGAFPLLSQELQDNLRQALDQAALDGGLWTGCKVAHWIEGYAGRKIETSPRILYTSGIGKCPEELALFDSKG